MTEQPEVRRASERDPNLPTPTPRASKTETADPLASIHPNRLVRVKHPVTGDHYTTTAALARRAGATLLPDHDAVDRYGQPLRRKRNLSRKEG